MTQAELDVQNAAFWNEICGSWLAEAAGIRGDEPDALDRYDAAFLEYYPYLTQYVDRFDLAGKRVLEIGLGYGTLGSLLVRHGADYYGVDLAEAPVDMMQRRLARAGVDPEGRARLGSALELPFEAGSFDYLYTIGCLHHTGDLERAVGEVERVLANDGIAVVMLYNRESLRQLEVEVARARAMLDRTGGPSDEEIRAMYDKSSSGQAAPHTEYVSPREAKLLFRAFRKVEIDIQNFEHVIEEGRIVHAREDLLSADVARMYGLDLYIVATK